MDVIDLLIVGLFGIGLITSGLSIMRLANGFVGRINSDWIIGFSMVIIGILIEYYIYKTY